MPAASMPAISLSCWSAVWILASSFCWCMENLFVSKTDPLSLKNGRIRCPPPGGSLPHRLSQDHGQDPEACPRPARTDGDVRKTSEGRVQFDQGKYLILVVGPD